MSLLLRVTAACWVLAIVVLVVMAIVRSSALPLAVIAAFGVAWAIVLFGARLIGGQGWDDPREA